MDNTVRVQVSVAAPTSPQGELRNSSPNLGELFACMPCGSSSRRENARRSPCSSFLRNYRAAHSFLLRGCGFRRILARRTPQQLSESRRAVCMYALRLLFASRKCKTFTVFLVPAELSHGSLIFAPRVRLPPHFSKATVAKPRALVRGFCIHACGSFSRRENARRSPCSSLPRNYRTAHSFLLRGCGSRRILARRQSQNLAHISARFLHPYNME